MAVSTPSSISQAPDVFAFLKTSLRLLEIEMPAAYGALCAQVGDLKTRLISSGRAKVLSFQGRVPTLEEEEESAAVEAAFDDSVILDLIDGHLSLQEALFTDRLCIGGAARDIERLQSALIVYLDGAIRLPEFAKLLERFRDLSKTAS